MTTDTLTDEVGHDSSEQKGGLMGAGSDSFGVCVYTFQCVYSCFNRVAASPTSSDMVALAFTPARALERHTSCEK